MLESLLFSVREKGRKTGGFTPYLPFIIDTTRMDQRRDKAEYVYIIISVALIENTVNSHMTHSHIGFMNVFDDPTKLNFLESMVVVI